MPSSAGTEPGAARPVTAGRRNRRPVRRVHRVEFSLGDDEYQALRTAAGAVGLSLGAYAARATVSVMSGQPGADVGRHGLHDALGALVRVTGQLRKLATNYNQAVAALHATGRPTGKPARLRGRVHAAGPARGRGGGGRAAGGARVIGKVSVPRGKRVEPLIWYLYGPGRREVL